ncbi:MAG: leucine-rich repeat protein [Alistipes sp.]|nr:leucine-rich repeat protein [Alistipes sp.]
MKKLFYFLSIVLLTIASSCSTEYDDSELIDRLNKLEEEQKKLEEEQKEMQEQIDAQQALIDALTKNLTITSIVETDEGYVITFSDNSTITVKQDSSFIENIEVEEDCITFTFADGRVVTLPLTNNDGNDGSGDSGEVVGENNKIYYTTSDGKKLFPYNTEPAAYGAVLVSNVYKDGQGVLTFDDTITSLKYQAFYECDSLTSITIPDSVTTIGVSTFANCHSLTSVTIPNGVTTIGNNAFQYCRSLTSVTIPDSVTTIGDYAFYGCSSLTSVTIGDSVTTIGQYAFRDCSSLTSVTIPDSVTTIESCAFYKCSSLRSVIIGSGVTEIGDCVFYDCTGELIVNCNIPSASGYDDGAFYHSKFTSVTIGDGVITIGDYAFYICSSLTSVTIPDSVTSIGREAFYKCSSLTSVYCKAVTPPTGDYDMFPYNVSDRKIYVPTKSVEAYKSASYWRSYADAIVGYNF